MVRTPLSVLSEVAICTEPTLRMQAVRAEVTEALTGILHFGSDDEELCALGLRAFRSLASRCADSPANQIAAGGEKSVASIVETMYTHRGVLDVVMPAVQALGNIAMAEDCRIVRPVERAVSAGEECAK